MSKLTNSPTVITHRVELFDLYAHLFRITLTIPCPELNQHIALPVWIPGSYLVREFSARVQGLAATQTHRKLGIRQLDKCTWDLGNTSTKAITVNYFVYAFDTSVRTAFLDDSRGFFNGTSLFMRVIGQEQTVQHVCLTQSSALPSTDHWHAITALPSLQTDANGFGIYQADHYDELADSPFTLGVFWQGGFTVRGVTHRLVVSGAATAFDSSRLLADTQKIVEKAMAFWHGKQKPPLDLRRKGYVFMLQVVADGYGGLEHKHSTALIAKRADLPRLGVPTSSDGYITLLGLISHEYFHTWNVKRLRPTELARYNYAAENHTQMLWFFEGFTSYYDDLLLRRAELIGDQTYLNLLAKTIHQVQQTPGRQVHSLAASSFEAWTKYYRPDENTVNSTVSYYTKGSLVALCLDLMLQSTPDPAKASNRPSLDQVMRGLWVRAHQAGNNGVISELDVLDELKQVGGRTFAREIKAWVHGTVDLPISQLLASAGVSTTAIPAPLTQQLGLRTSSEGGSIKIKQVLNGTLAAAAGFAAGDEWLAIEANKQIWRITSIDEVAHYTQTNQSVLAWIARDKRVIKLTLKMPKTNMTNAEIKLQITDAKKLNRWLKK